LRLLVDETLALLAPRAQAKHLALATEFEAGLPVLLHGDAGRIRQVLINLLGNAVKFTQKGGVALVVKGLAASEDNVSFRLEVRDTGIGIPEAYQPRLFEAFSQLDGSTTKSAGGTGLGLAISRQLIGLMGGKIGFESEFKRGSVFWFELGLPRAKPTTELPSSAPEPAAVGCLRLLVVEDNTSNQMVMRCLLEKLGHEYEVAADGQSALDRLALDRFDAVLMDCQMPGMDGYTATREIRAGRVSGLDVHIPIIALTAYAMPADRKKCLDSGMDDYVSKPVRSEHLQAALGRLLGRKTENLPPPEPSLRPVQHLLDLPQLEQLRQLPGRQHSRLIDDMIGLFLASMPQELSQLRQLAEQKSKNELAMLAHSIAGTCANLGASAMRSSGLQLENAAREGNWTEVRGRLDALGRQWIETKQALQQFQTPILHENSYR
jgi:CheY-like chemotaxis protein/HPt (histidine-containing phosphotransfer) domain-containing protein